MKEQIHLQVVTASETVYDGMVSYVSIPLENGSIGVLANHAPLIGAVADGTVLARGESGEEKITVGIGVANVTHNEVRILVRSASRCEK